MQILSVVHIVMSVIDTQQLAIHAKGFQLDCLRLEYICLDCLSITCICFGLGAASLFLPPLSVMKYHFKSNPVIYMF